MKRQRDSNGCDEKDLCRAARDGNLAQVQKLLQNSALSVNYKSRSTALQLACMGSHLDVAKLLLKNGAFINARTQDGKIALHHACRRDLELSKFLI